MGSLRLSFVLALFVVMFFPQESAAQGWKFWSAQKQLEGPTVCGEGVPISPACQKEFDDWLAKEKRWRRLYAIWANYPMYHGTRTPLMPSQGRKALKRPDIPWWLAAHCVIELSLSNSTKSAVCAAYDEAVRYDWTLYVAGPESRITYTVKAPSMQVADTNKFLEFFMKNAHFDAIWTNSSIGGGGGRLWAGGGMHLTMANMGIFYLWGGTGVIALRKPDGSIRLATTFGIDVRLGKMPLPFTEHKTPVYLSIARAMEKTDVRLMTRGVNAGIDMVGLNFTIK